MINFAISVFWLLAPAGLANMMPILIPRIPFLAHPVDFGKKYLGKRILGSHKLFHGFVVGTLGGVLGVYIQQWTFSFTQVISIIDYSAVNPWVLGSLLGFGALFGDSVKSFFKRQRGIKPGKSWMPFDQIDWVIGSLVFLSFYMLVSLDIWLTGIILFFVVHILARFLGYKLGIVKAKI